MFREKFSIFKRIYGFIGHMDLVGMFVSKMWKLDV